MALTRRQKEFLDFLVGFTDSNGYSPSYEEIASALDLASLATVHKHVSALEMKGYLRRGFNQSRSLEVSPKYLQEFKRSEDWQMLRRLRFRYSDASRPVHRLKPFREPNGSAFRISLLTRTRTRSRFGANR